MTTPKLATMFNWSDISQEVFSLDEAQIQELLKVIWSPTSKKQMVYLLERFGTKVPLQEFQDFFKLKTPRVVGTLVEFFKEIDYTLSIDWENLILISNAKLQEKESPVLKVVASTPMAVAKVMQQPEVSDFLAYAQQDLQQIPWFTFSNVDNYIVEWVGLSTEEMNVFLYFVSKFPWKVSFEEIKKVYGDTKLNYLKSMIAQVNKRLSSASYKAQIRTYNNQAFIANFGDIQEKKEVSKKTWVDFSFSDNYTYIKCNGEVVPLQNEIQFRWLKKLITGGGNISEGQLVWGKTATNFLNMMNGFFAEYNIALNLNLTNGTYTNEKWFNVRGKCFILSSI